MSLGTELKTITKSNPRLSLAEERTLGIAAYNGDEEARVKLFNANLGLALKFSDELQAPHCPFDDCVSLALEALYTAAGKFDPGKYSTRFSTFASTVIRNNLIRNYRKQSRRSYFEKNNVYAYSKRGLAMASLKCNSDQEPEEAAITKDRTEKLNKALGKLSARDAYILRSRFGIAPFTQEVSVKDLAKIEGLSKQRVSQLCARAIERLTAVYRELE